jgi:hypothetical protein
MSDSADAYTGFDAMLLAGEWRPGSAGPVLTDRNPYSGESGRCRGIMPRTPSSC